MKKSIIVISLLMFSAMLNASESYFKNLKSLENNSHPTVITKIQIPTKNNSSAVAEILSKHYFPAFNMNYFKPYFIKSIGDKESSLFRYNLTYKGYPVEGVSITAAVKNNNIYRITSNAEEIDVEPSFNISEEDAAIQAAFFHAGIENLNKLPKFSAEKVIYKDLNSWKSAYKIRFQPVSIDDSRIYFIDANNGELLGGGNRTVYATNMAKVFPDNPLRTPDLLEVELPWIDDSKNGFLTSTPHSSSNPKIVAANCPDKGEILDVEGYGKMPVCTPEQIANKEKNGSFIYEDYADILASKFNANDIFPEVSAYYHTSKLYKYLEDLNVGFKELNSTIIVVANFQMAEGGTKIRPMSNAFFAPAGFDSLLMPNFTYSGNVIAMGQGNNIDTAVDGDVIYHEFGHAVVDSTAALTSFPVADKYGYQILAQSLNEGIADTFSFMVGGDPCLAEFFGDSAGGMSYEPLPNDGEFTCLRTAKNKNKVNADFVGESHHDGLPVSGANWEIFQLALSKNINKDEFAKLVLKVLLSLSSKSTYIDYAETFMSEVENNNIFAPLKDDINKIFESRNFYDEVRAANIADAKAVFSGGTEGYPVSYYKAEIDGVEMKIAPSYVQLYFDMPEDKNKAVIKASYVFGMSQVSSGNPKYSLLLREGEPVEYDRMEIPVAIKYDRYIEGIGGKEWTIDNLKPGKRYYISFINKAVTGVMAGIKFTTSLEGELPSEDADIISDNDEDVVENDAVVQDEDNSLENDNIAQDEEAERKDDSSNAASPKKSKDSGCSVIIL